MRISCIMFDLDGTLVDTAPDLIACLNVALKRHGFPEVDGDLIKPLISFGAVAMIEAALSEPADDALRQRLLDTMLDHYQNHIAEYTVLYP
ncbi:MAG: HAD hydrolase-like protein, partial [Gammaproteobacteria bacterium]